jgi:hypothetical protein
MSRLSQYNRYLGRDWNQTSLEYERFIYILFNAFVQLQRVQSPDWGRNIIIEWWFSVWKYAVTTHFKSIYRGSAVLLLNPGRLFSFFIFYTIGRTPWTGDQPVARPLPTHRTTQTQNKRTQTSMTGVEFEPTIPVFERAKTVHILNRADTDRLSF